MDPVKKAQVLRQHANEIERTKQAGEAKMEADRAVFWDQITDPEALGVAGWQFLNSALLGIPELIASRVQSPAYRESARLRDERHRAAKTAGDIGGLLVPTPAMALGAAAKGLKALKGAKSAGKVAKAAKALDNAADFMKASGKYKGVTGMRAVGHGAGRAAVEAGAQVAPGLAVGDISPGDALLSTALGAGVGGAAGGLSNLVGKAKAGKGIAGEYGGKLSGDAVKGRIAQRGVTKADAERVMRRFAKADMLPGAERATMIEDGIYDTLDRYFKAKGTPIRAEAVKNAFMGKNVGELTADIAKITDVPEDTAKWAALTLQEAFARDASDLGSSAAGIAKGAVRNTTLPLIAGTVAGAGSIYDSEGNLNIEEAVRRGIPIAVAAALAQQAGKAAPGLQGIAGKALTKVDDVIAKVPGRTLNVAEAAAPVLARKIGGDFREDAIMNRDATAGVRDVAELETAAAETAADPTAQLATEPAESLSGTDQVLRDRALAEMQIPQEVAEEQAFNQMKVGAAANQRAKQYGAGYMDKLNDKMLKYWARNFSDQMEYDTYKALVAEATDGFAPDKSASFLYSDKKERGRFLKSLETVKRLEGVDLDDLYTKENEFLGLNKDAVEANARRSKAESDLIDTIAGLITNEGNIASDSTNKLIRRDIATIVDQEGISAEDKKSQLMDLLAFKYGLGYRELQEMGLV